MARRDVASHQIWGCGSHLQGLQSEQSGEVSHAGEEKWKFPEAVPDKEVPGEENGLPASDESPPLVVQAEGKVGDDKKSRGGRQMAWTAEEDEKLMQCVDKHGMDKWMAVAEEIGRSPVSCRLRWMSVMAPNIRKGYFTKAEEDFVSKLYGEYGNKWAKIARKIRWRTENEIRSFWRSKKAQFKKPRRSNSMTKKKEEPVHYVSVPPSEMDENIFHVQYNDVSVLPHYLFSPNPRPLPSQELVLSVNVSSQTNAISTCHHSSSETTLPLSHNMQIQSGYTFGSTTYSVLPPRPASVISPLRAPSARCQLNMNHLEPHAAQQSLIQSTNASTHFASSVFPDLNSRPPLSSVLWKSSTSPNSIVSSSTNMISTSSPACRCSPAITPQSSTLVSPLRLSIPANVPSPSSLQTSTSAVPDNPISPLRLTLSTPSYCNSSNSQITWSPVELDLLATIPLAPTTSFCASMETPPVSPLSLKTASPAMPSRTREAAAPCRTLMRSETETPLISSLSMRTLSPTLPSRTTEVSPPPIRQVLQAQVPLKHCGESTPSSNCRLVQWPKQIPSSNPPSASSNCRLNPRQKQMPSSNPPPKTLSTTSTSATTLQWRSKQIHSGTGVPISVQPSTEELPSIQSQDTSSEPISGVDFKTSTENDENFQEVLKVMRKEVVEKGEALIQKYRTLARENPELLKKYLMEKLLRFRAKRSLETCSSGAEGLPRASNAAMDLLGQIQKEDGTSSSRSTCLPFQGKSSSENISCETSKGKGLVDESSKDATLSTRSRLPDLRTLLHGKGEGRLSDKSKSGNSSMEGPSTNTLWSILFPREGIKQIQNTTAKSESEWSKMIRGKHRSVDESLSRQMLVESLKRKASENKILEQGGSLSSRNIKRKIGEDQSPSLLVPGENILLKPSRATANPVHPVFSQSTIVFTPRFDDNTTQNLTRASPSGTSAEGLKQIGFEKPSNNGN